MEADLFTDANTTIGAIMLGACDGDGSNWKNNTFSNVIQLPDGNAGQDTSNNLWYTKPQTAPSKL